MEIYENVGIHCRIIRDFSRGKNHQYMIIFEILDENDLVLAEFSMCECKIRGFIKLMERVESNLKKIKSGKELKKIKKKKDDDYSMKYIG